jgi:hypothetical protein
MNLAYQATFLGWLLFISFPHFKSNEGIREEAILVIKTVQNPMQQPP